MLYRRIRDLREDHDLTQTQMGKILSCSQRVYSNYERGELDIPTEILCKLARYYGVTTDYLLNLSDVMWPYGEGKDPLRTKSAAVRCELPRSYHNFTGSCRWPRRRRRPAQFFPPGGSGQSAHSPRRKARSWSPGCR